MKRFVAKIGTQVLCRPDGLLDTETLADLVGQIAKLRENGWQVLLVSSGAVAAGMGEKGTEKLVNYDPVTRKQVLAATGQLRLMQTYQSHFSQHGLGIAQVLASKSDFKTRNHYLNMRNCIEGILNAGIVPIVNENDTVSITELMFTDNDELAGLLAGMVNADLLCMLSSVPGVYGNNDKVIRSWDDTLHQVEEIVSSGTSRLGRGGMHSKITVARKAAALGIEVVIAHGLAAGILLKVANRDNVGTRFPAGAPVSPTKRWLASSDDYAVGAAHVNQGAAHALSDKSRLTSLLLVGVESVEGDFKRGDIIRIVDKSGRVLGVGRSEYDREEASSLIGQRGHKALIHCNYLYLKDEYARRSAQ